MFFNYSSNRYKLRAKYCCHCCTTYTIHNFFGLLWSLFLAVKYPLRPFAFCILLEKNWTIFNIFEFIDEDVIWLTKVETMSYNTNHFMVARTAKTPSWSKPWPSNGSHFISMLTRNRSYCKWTISWKSQSFFLLLFSFSCCKKCFYYLWLDFGIHPLV